MTQDEMILPRCPDGTVAFGNMVTDWAGCDEFVLIPIEQ